MRRLSARDCRPVATGTGRGASMPTARASAWSGRLRRSLRRPWSRDRKNGVEGKRGAGSVHHGGRCISKKQQITASNDQESVRDNDRLQLSVALNKLERERK